MYSADSGLKSKRVLLDKEVINLVSTELIGPKSIDSYYSCSTEWVDGTQSSVLYATNDGIVFPPILIEVQHVADDAFLHRVVRCCEEINKKYGAVPVVLVFVVNKMCDVIMHKASKDRKHPFLLKLPCFPWARNCLFLSGESIHDHLADSPLSPLVALGTFLATKKPCIIDHGQEQDPTIKMLYNISKNTVENENTIVDDLLSLCEKSEEIIREGVKILEEGKTPNTNKRAIDCLNDGLDIIKSYRLKYTPNGPSLPSPPIVIIPSEQGPASPLELPSRSELSTRNWEFVNDYMQNLGDSRMNWKACFAEGQRQGFFLNYINPASLKNSYQRWKKQQI